MTGWNEGFEEEEEDAFGILKKSWATDFGFKVKGFLQKLNLGEIGLQFDDDALNLMEWVERETLEADTDADAELGKVTMADETII